VLTRAHEREFGTIDGKWLPANPYITFVFYILQIPCHIPSSLLKSLLKTLNSLMSKDKCFQPFSAARLHLIPDCFLTAELHLVECQRYMAETFEIS
jgi:hypothetical protein